MTTESRAGRVASAGVGPVWTVRVGTAEPRSHDTRIIDIVPWPARLSAGRAADADEVGLGPRWLAA